MNKVYKHFTAIKTCTVERYQHPKADVSPSETISNRFSPQHNVETVKSYIT